MSIRSAVAVWALVILLGVCLLASVGCSVQATPQPAPPAPLVQPVPVQPLVVPVRPWWFWPWWRPHVVPVPVHPHHPRRGD